jgi:hypothetical protein
MNRSRLLIRISGALLTLTSAKGYANCAFPGFDCANDTRPLCRADLGYCYSDIPTLSAVDAMYSMVDDYCMSSGCLPPFERLSEPMAAVIAVHGGLRQLHRSQRNLSLVRGLTRNFFLTNSVSPLFPIIDRPLVDEQFQRMYFGLNGYYQAASPMRALMSDRVWDMGPANPGRVSLATYGNLVNYSPDAYPRLETRMVADVGAVIRAALLARKIVTLRVRHHSQYGSPFHEVDYSRGTPVPNVAQGTNIAWIRPSAGSSSAPDATYVVRGFESVSGPSSGNYRYVFEDPITGTHLRVRIGKMPTMDDAGPGRQYLHRVAFGPYVGTYIRYDFPKEANAQFVRFLERETQGPSCLTPNAQCWLVNEVNVLTVN